MTLVAASSPLSAARAASSCVATTARTPSPAAAADLIATGRSGLWAREGETLINARRGQVVGADVELYELRIYQFTPRGEHAWLSARDDHKVLIYDSESFALLGELPADSPSGIFFTHRAHRTGL